MLIYLVRHGQTTGNKEHRFQTSETELSPEGELQAQKVAERLQNTTFNELWSSPMTRALKTAELINQYQHLEIKQIPQLAEMKRATSIQGKLISDPGIKDVSRLLENNFKFDPYLRIEDGESYVDVIERCQQVVELLKKRAADVPDDHLVCVTTHGIMLATLYFVLELGEFATPEACVYALRHVRIENTSLTIVRFPKKGDHKVLTFSDFAHL